MVKKPQRKENTIDIDGAEKVRLAGEHYRSLSAQELNATILREEQELDFDSFGLEDAWEVGSWIRTTALERGLGIGFAVALGEHRAFQAATPGGAAVNGAWLDRKFRVVRLYEHASLGVKADYEARGETFASDSSLDQLLYAAAGGGFPIRVRGTLVGSAGVSGLEMHEDHALVVEALRARKAAQGQSTAA